MSLVNSTLPMLNLRMLDMVGHVSYQRLHARIFDAYDVKSLVLEMYTPQQQRALVQLKRAAAASSGGVAAAAAAAAAVSPAVIENWAELEASFKPTNLYQLRPRRARTNTAYQAIRGIVACPGSPFTMEDRADPSDLKLLFKPPDFEYRNQFNARNPEKVGTAVQFDGLLRTNSAIGLLMCHQHVTPAQVNSIVGSITFLREWASDAAEAERHKELKTKWQQLLSRQQWTFLASNTVVNKDVLSYARGKQVCVFVRRGLNFSFTP